MRQRTLLVALVAAVLVAAAGSVVTTAAMHTRTRSDGAMGGIDTGYTGGGPATKDSGSTRSCGN
ncbi:hypothetical protein SK571_29410 [Lentzea sp. BCCO 10_0798]|uniref:Uncharacterized protein n=1 Tax=Lentzea kristufekii TaxID=3095430 RepID=A0ABU4TYW7_9PSEU|nr:hypothetical protein [Lentzea sp. BCCO 10_0798]MDX8053509.1 hypothetical protein [Lentzea sp. BCCO 10_0798]